MIRAIDMIRTSILIIKDKDCFDTTVWSPREIGINRLAYHYGCHVHQIIPVDHAKSTVAGAQLGKLNYRRKGRCLICKDQCASHTTCTVGCCKFDSHVQDTCAVRHAQQPALLLVLPPASASLSCLFTKEIGSTVTWLSITSRPDGCGLYQGILLIKVIL